MQHSSLCQKISCRICTVFFTITFKHHNYLSLFVDIPDFLNLFLYLPLIPCIILIILICTLSKISLSPLCITLPAYSETCITSDMTLLTTNCPRIMLAYLCAAQYKVEFIASSTNAPTSFSTLITYSSFPLIVVMCPSF